MGRHSQPKLNRYSGIWLLSAALAVGLLTGVKSLHADESLNVESSDEDYYGEPTLVTESSGASVHSEVSGDEEYVTEESAKAERSGCQCHNHLCQSDSSQCCKKGECNGVCLDPGHPAKPKHKKPGDVDQGDCPSIRYRMDDCLRSGDPDCVYKWAKPSITNKYSAWYVGGGAWFKGRGRTAEEGTWGLDYDGAFGHARTWLNYTCGKRQGGEGAYETDHVPLKKKF